MTAKTATTKKAIQKAVTSKKTTTAKAKKPLLSSENKRTVCIVGAGNWGSTAAKIIGENVLYGAAKQYFAEEVRMWTREEMVKLEDGSEGKLSEIINTTHENVKYLKGVKLPPNVKSVPDMQEAVKGASVLVWVLPHQFIPATAKGMKEAVGKDTVSISLVKGGVDINADGLKLCSETISEILGHDVSVIMGANVADEVARGDFCEATIGATSKETGELFHKLFDTKTFSVNVVPEVASVELCGALKNVVALAAGFVDGVGMGGNTKAAVVRIGLKEMQKFITHFYPKTKAEVFQESCGVADLITTCFGGRNRKCAEAFAESRVRGEPRSWDEIETTMLNGQKIQGTLTAQEIMPLIQHHRLESELPLMCATYNIAFKDASPKTLCDCL
jgi:glycerol-3-phosphate dehydrogenase (NAD+)